MDFFLRTITTNPLILLSWWMLIVVLGGVLVTRGLTMAQKILIVFYRTQPSDGVRTKGDSRWQITIVQAIIWVLKVMVWIVVSTMVASKLGLPASLIAALGTVLGAALGFGSQETVRDVVKGTVHLMEKQFSVGDVVGFTIGGIDYVGVVEDVTLRTVMVSTESDGVVSVPQGNIAVIKNYSRGRGEFLVKLPFSTDQPISPILSGVTTIIGYIRNRNTEVLAQYVDDEDMEALSAINTVDSRGVGEVSSGSIIIQVKGEAIPGKQFAAQRALLKAVSGFLDDQGIEFQKIPVMFGGGA